MTPRINFTFYEYEYVPGTTLVIVEIDAAVGYPSSFQKKVYIRVGSYTKPIAEHRGKEKALWGKLDTKVFESGIAKSDLSVDEVLSHLEYNVAFTKLDIPLPDTKVGIVDRLIEADLVTKERGRYAITNLGAILFATNLSLFGPLARKALRVIIYKGKNKLITSHERKGVKGYAVGINNIAGYIQTFTSEGEVVEGAVRKQKSAYPNIAVREMIANALIHQDFSVSGAGPMVEVFDNRMEISNPGAPLVEIARIIDRSPRSRNDKLARMMSRMGICEERGSGVDKVVIACELNKLPAPEFKAEDDFTRATLYTARSLRAMTKDDKIRATYYHTVIRFITDGYMENSTLRERFGIAKENYPTASNIIRMTIDAGYIKPREGDSGPYVPFWA